MREQAWFVEDVCSIGRVFTVREDFFAIGEMGRIEVLVPVEHVRPVVAERIIRPNIVAVCKVGFIANGNVVDWIWVDV